MNDAERINEIVDGAAAHDAREESYDDVVAALRSSLTTEPDPFLARRRINLMVEAAAEDIPVTQPVTLRRPGLIERVYRGVASSRIALFCAVVVVAALVVAGLALAGVFGAGQAPVRTPGTSPITSAPPSGASGAPAPPSGATGAPANGGSAPSNSSAGLGAGLDPASACRGASITSVDAVVAGNGLSVTVTAHVTGGSITVIRAQVFGTTFNLSRTAPGVFQGTASVSSSVPRGAQVHVAACSGGVLVGQATTH